MADTTTAANNRPVKFGAKPQAEKAGTTETAAGEGAAVKPPRPVTGAAKTSAIRKTAKRAIKRGMISEKAAKLHLKDY